MGARSQYKQHNIQLRTALRGLLSLFKPTNELDTEAVRQAKLALNGHTEKFSTGLKGIPNYKPDFTYHDKQNRGTVVGVIQGTELVFGVALKSYQDQFSRKLGRVIATGRAVKNPADCVDIQAHSDEAVAEVFYTMAPELLEKKKDEVMTRQIVTRTRTF